MNIPPQQLVDALEGKLPPAEVTNLISNLRQLPPAAVLSVAAQANISITGDGNIVGNNSKVFVIKGELQGEVARILQQSQDANDAVGRRQVLAGYLDALRIYCEQLPYISLRGKRRPLLSTIYIEQRPEEQIAKDYSSSTCEEDTEEPEPESRIETVEQALMRHRHLVIEGQPGIGKSTLVSHLALTLTDVWQQNKDTFLIPVRVFARSFASRTGSFSQCLNEQVNAELGKLLQHVLPPNLFAHAPAANMTWLVMVDGLDEIVASDPRNQLIQAIAYHAARTDSHYRFLVTTRPIADTDRFGHAFFGHYVLRPFEPSQVEAFAQSWFRSDPGSQDNDADQFLLQIKESRIADLAQIPLLLTMAAVIYEANRDRVLPVYRADLYRRFIKILLDDEESERQTREPFRREWDKRYGQAGMAWADHLFSQRQQLLTHLALWKHLGNTGSLIDEAVYYIREQEWIPQRIDIEWLHGQVEVLLRRTGLLSSSDVGDNFIHNTFREYLAASSFASLYDPDEAKTWTMVSRMAKGDEQEVALFLLGIWSSRGQDVTKIIRYITKSDGNKGLLFSGTALAEGAKIVEEVVEEIVDGLIAYSEKLDFHDFQNTLNPLNVLSRLQDRERVINGFASLALNPRANDYVRLQAAQLLSQLGYVEEAVSIFISIAQDLSIRIYLRIQSIELLSYYDRNRELLLVANNKNIAAEVRLRAIIKLTGLAVSEGWADPLIRLLLSFAHDQSQSGEVRVRAIREMIDLGPSGDLAKTVLQALRALVLDQSVDRMLRVRGIKELERFRLSGDLADSAIQILCALVLDQSKNKIVRRQAIQELKVLGRFEGLTGAVIQGWHALGSDRSANASLRVQAIKELKGLDHSGSLADIIFQVSRSLALDRSADAGFRLYAIKELKGLGRSEGCADTITQALQSLALDPSVDARVREVASRELNGLDHSIDLADTDVQVLCALVLNKSMEAEVRLRTIRELKKHSLSGDSLDTITQALRSLALDPSVDAEIWRCALTELEEIILSIQTLLLEANTTPQMRIQAFKYLSQYGTTDQIIDAGFILATDQTLPLPLRLQIVEELLNSGLLEEDAIGILSSLAQDSVESPEFRIQAVKMLGRFSQSESLLRVASNLEVDTLLRGHAIKALEQVGNQRILSKLQHLSHADRDRKIRRAAQHAIDRIQERMHQSVDEPSES